MELLLNKARIKSRFRYLANTRSIKVGRMLVIRRTKVGRSAQTASIDTIQYFRKQRKSCMDVGQFELIQI